MLASIAVQRFKAKRHSAQMSMRVAKECTDLFKELKDEKGKSNGNNLSTKETQSTSVADIKRSLRKEKFHPYTLKAYSKKSLENLPNIEIKKTFIERFKNAIDDSLTYFDLVISITKLLFELLIISFLVIIYSTISLAEFLIAFNNMENCPLEFNIPFYLLISSSLQCVISFQMLYIKYNNSFIQKNLLDDDEEDDDVLVFVDNDSIDYYGNPDRKKKFNVLKGSIETHLMMLFFILSTHIFGIFNISIVQKPSFYFTPNQKSKPSIYYCEKKVYYLVLFNIILHTILYILILIYLIILILIRGYTLSKQQQQKQSRN
jgi:hypothetical protein